MIDGTLIPPVEGMMHSKIVIKGPIPDHKLKVFKDMLIVYSSLSKDPRTKVAAMILRPDLSIVSQGYNGFPAGFPDDPKYWDVRETKNALVIHAEENALSYSPSSFLNNHILICTHYPCPRCASKIIKSGISHVYYFNEKRVDHNCELTDEVFQRAGVSTYFIG
ncbi:MAG: cytidine deaminase [Ignavibacteria bacterium]